MAKKTAPTPEKIAEGRRHMMQFMAFSGLANHEDVGEFAMSFGYRKMDVTPCSEYYLKLKWLNGDVMRQNAWNARTSIDGERQCAVIAHTRVETAGALYTFTDHQYDMPRFGYRGKRETLTVTRALNAYCRMKPETLKIFGNMDDMEVGEPDELEKIEAAKVWEQEKKKLNMLENVYEVSFVFLRPLAFHDIFLDFFRELPAEYITYFLSPLISVAESTGVMATGVYESACNLLELTKGKIDDLIYFGYKDKCYFLGHFLKVGDLDKALEDMHAGTFFYDAIRAMKFLQENMPNEAFKVLEKAYKGIGSLISSVSYINFIWGLTLLLADSPAAQKKAEVLAKKKEIKENYHIPTLQLFIEMKLHPETDFNKWVNKNIYTFGTPITEMALFAMVCKLYGYKLEKMEYYQEYAYMLFQSGTNVMALEFGNVFDNIGINVPELEKKLKMHTFMPKYEKKEDWEIIIGTLMKKYGKAKSSTAKDKPAKMEVSRIAYLIDPRYFSVTPKLQKSKDGGVTWSAGRNVALTTFEKPMPEKTEQDKEVAKHVKTYSYGWYGGTSHSLEGEKVVEALIGHPAVFLEANPDLKIEIVEDKLQIEVKETPKGFKVVHNATKKDETYESLNIKIETPQLYKVLKLKKEETEILTLLDRVSLFPLNAKEQLTRLLEALGSKVTVVSALLKNSETVQCKKGDTKITMQLIPYGEEFTARCFVKPLAGNPPYCTPGKGLEFIATKIKDKPVQIERNRKKELQNLKEVEEWMSPFDDFREEEGWTVPMVECLGVLDLMREHSDKCLIEWPEGVRLKVVHPMLNAANLKLSVKGMDHWFSVDGEVQIDDKLNIKISELLKRVREAKGNFIQIGDDEYVALNQQLKKYLASLDHVTQTEKKNLKVSQYNSSFLEDLKGLGAEVDTDDSYNELVKNLKEADEIKVKIPKMLQADLRDYQKDGYRWLSRLAHWGAGACLADDMGLGKTIQTIALLLSRAADGASLVIMPTSVLMNWRDEIAKFAPSLNTVILRSSADREAAVKSVGPQDVVLATYGLLPTEEELLTQKKWNIIVLDEAHTIKNKETKTSKVAMQLEGKFRLLLTGTPLQNHLSEIWNLFQFATPGLLTNFTQFSQEFITPIERDQDKDRQRLLKRMLSPFILRRTKSEVLNELPEKTEITLKVELSDAERALYNKFREEAIQNLEDGSTSPIQALAELTKLRQTACNAALVLPKKEAKLIPSSKMEAFLKLVEELQRNHHRALVFSQFTSHLALVEDELKKLDIKYEYLDGSTSPTERIRRVEEFQKGDMPLFLISLKAGGTGLNLTAADYVIHLDPWWNPAIEDQASDRAYRIGQDKPVTVYRLIAEDTIEEKIIALHQTKKSLADALLEGSDMSHALGKDEILSLLRETRL